MPKKHTHSITVIIVDERTEPITLAIKRQGEPVRSFSVSPAFQRFIDQLSKRAGVKIVRL